LSSFFTDAANTGKLFISPQFLILELLKTFACIPIGYWPQIRYFNSWEPSMLEKLIIVSFLNKRLS
jgi:hypothetical protein